MTDRLLIEEAGDGTLRVAHQRAGAAFAEAPSDPFAFAPPLGEEDLEDLRWYLEDYLIAPFAVYEERGRAIEARLDGWGEALFATTFADPRARIAYERAMEREGGARLAVLGRSAAFLGLPWELLKDPGRADPLALRLGAFDRLVAAPAAPAEVPPGEELRVLMAIARPEGLKDVGFQMVARPLMERLEAVRGRVALEVLRPPSFDALKKRLFDAAGEGRPFHVLHFDGHGTFGEDPAAGFSNTQFKGPQGYLIFEKPAGGPEPVAADDFARAIVRAKVPVAVLNACRSGTVAQGTSAAAVEAAVATRLLHEGAASVVAMGYSVYAVAAAEFMAAFYEALFAGESVSAAVAAGRERMKRNSSRPSPKGPLPLRDWIVPVHYSRREVAFPRLRRQRAADLPDLDAMLDAVGGGAVSAEARLSDPLAPDRRFVGRGREFYALELALRTDRVVLLRGTAGTGKTELAKAFGRWWRDTGGVDEPGWVLFQGFAPGTATFGLDAAATAVGLAVFGPDFVRRAATRELREAVVLRLLRERRLLLVWDNVESLRSMPNAASGSLPEAECARLRRFLDALRAPGGRSGVVLTSRAPEDWLGEDLRRIEVGGLDPAEAAELAEDLLEGLPAARARRGERSFAELVQWLGGHPLSLRVLLPKLEAVPPAALLTMLKGATEDLPPGFEGPERTAHLGASLKLSLDQLDPAARDRALALGLFEGTADEQVLAAFSAEAEVPGRFAAVTREEWAALLDRLAAVGLVTRPGLGMADLHPALPAWMLAVWRAAAGGGFAAEREAAEQALRRAYAGFVYLLSQQISGGAAAAFNLLDRQRRTLGRLLRGALGAGAWEEAHAMLRPLDAFLGARGLGPEASAWAAEARRAVEEASGGKVDLGTESGALWFFAEGSEANRALKAGDLAAAECAYDAFCRRLEAEGGEASRLALAFPYHQLGMVAQARGELAAAEKWYRRSLEIMEALGDRPGMAGIYHQLGMLAQARGELAAAEKWYRRSLEIMEALGDRPGMAGIYHQLGMLAQARGELAAAEKWYRRSLEIMEALGDRPGMAGIYHQLGMLAQARGELAGVLAQARGELAAAEGWYRRSLEIAEALGNRPGMAGTYHQLGMLAQARGELEIAEVRGDRPGMAGTYHQLGMLAQARGELAAAEKWYRRSLEIMEALGDRPGMAKGYHQLGVVAYLRGELAAAEGWYRRSLEIAEALGDRPGMAFSYGQMGLLAEARGDLAAALEGMVRCVALFDDFPHPVTGPGPNHLARLTRALGVPALEAAWRRVTGGPLPEAVHTGLKPLIAQLPPG